MKRWTFDESFLLSKEAIALTLLLLPICGLAFHCIVEGKKKRSSVEDGSRDGETIFDSALKRFQLFIDVQRDDTLRTIERESSRISIDSTVDYVHQVAGHTSEVLRAFQGKVLKPMVKQRLFVRELCLYEKMALSANSDSGLPILFVPNYIGLALVQSTQKTIETGKTLRISTVQTHLVKFIRKLSKLFHVPEIKYINNCLDKKLLPHLVLDDLTLSYKAPCVIDIKMGQQTYEPDANSSKKKREIRKCPYQVITGFRITGMKVFDVINSTYSYKDKQFGRAVQPDDIAGALRIFFWNGISVRKDVITKVIDQLKKILAWFENQNVLHFYCSSILIIYDGRMNVGVISDGNQIGEDWGSSSGPRGWTEKTKPRPLPDLVQVKMIDFAHTLPSPLPKDIDHGYILGIKNLINKLNTIMNM